MKKITAGKYEYILCKRCGKPWNYDEFYKRDGADIRELVNAGRCPCGQHWVVEFMRALDIEIR